MTTNDTSKVIQAGRDHITSALGYEEVRLQEYAALKGFMLIHFIYYSRDRTGVYRAILLWSPISQQFTILKKIRYPEVI